MSCAKFLAPRQCPAITPTGHWSPAGNTIVDGRLSVGGWRSAHPSHPAAPWSQDIVPGQAPVAGAGMGAAGAAFTGVPGLPEHVQLTGNGQLNVQGLDWWLFEF